MEKCMEAQGKHTYPEQKGWLKIEPGTFLLFSDSATQNHQSTWGCIDVAEHTGILNEDKGITLTERLVLFCTFV